MDVAEHEGLLLGGSSGVNVGAKLAQLLLVICFRAFPSGPETNNSIFIGAVRFSFNNSL